MIDVVENRRAMKWTRVELFRRFLWELITPLFKYSPRIFWQWRNFILRLFGASIGAGVHIFPSVKIAIPWNLTIGDHSSIGDRAIVYSLGKISIGLRTTISQGVHLCGGSHDYSNSSMPLLKEPITVGDDVWICADSFLCPGISIQNDSIVGARCVVTKDVPEKVIVAGNPGVVIKDL